MIRHLHDNKGNQLFVRDNPAPFVYIDNGKVTVWDTSKAVFWVTLADGTTTGPFKSLSGAAKSITGYEVNGRKYWKLAPPRENDPRWQLVCDKGYPLSAHLTMLDPDEKPGRVVHLHTSKFTHGEFGLCDADNDTFLPDNEAAVIQFAQPVLSR